ncbi:MAG TPA: hypothetical protein VE007_12305, partial [Thermoanaerobaculia bacterium]|nr:hypothetical protein [Thermoanaerobaculia bacterium]
MWFARGAARYAVAALVAFSVALGPARRVEGASCPTNAVEIGAPQQYVFQTSVQSNIVLITYITMGRRSPSLYTATKYGSIGMYLGSNPSDPTPTIDNVSFRTNPKGPVGGGTGKDCWPGPSSLAVADDATGAGRIGMGWTGGCGSPAQALITNAPGGQSTFGQQLDPNGNGTAVYGGTVATALTSSGKYAAYFADSKGAYVVDVSNPTGNATSTPIGPLQTIPAWAGANYLFSVGNSSSDQYVAAVFFGTKTVKLASVGSDGRLTVLSTSAALSSSSATGSNEQKTAIYSTGNGYELFVAVSNGIDVFSLQNGQLSRLGTVANASSTDKYALI